MTVSYVQITKTFISYLISVWNTVFTSVSFNWLFSGSQRVIQEPNTTASREPSSENAALPAGRFR